MHTKVYVFKKNFDKVSILVIKISTFKYWSEMSFNKPLLENISPYWADFYSAEYHWLGMCKEKVTSGRSLGSGCEALLMRCSRTRQQKKRGNQEEEQTTVESLNLPMA